MNKPEVSDMQEYLAESSITHENFKSNMNIFTELETIKTFLCYGISHHDVLFDEERKDDEMENMLVPPTPQQKGVK